MEQLYLMPGEERYTKFQDENGVPKVRYTYCSLHGRLFYLNHLPKSTYLILSAPSEGSEIRFFCKKETRLRKAGFPACAAPAFSLQKCYFHVLFLS